MSRAGLALAAATAAIAAGCRSAPVRIDVTPPFRYEHKPGDSPRLRIGGDTVTLERACLGTVRIRTRQIHVNDPLHTYGDGQEEPRRVDVEPGLYPVYFAGSTDSGKDLHTSPLFVLSLRSGSPSRWFVEVHSQVDSLVVRNGKLPFFAADSHMAAIMDTDCWTRYRGHWSGHLDKDDIAAWDALIGISETTLGGFGIRQPYATSSQDARFRESQAYWVRQGFRINFETESDLIVCYGQACGTTYWGVNDRDETVCMVLRFE